MVFPGVEDFDKRRLSIQVVEKPVCNWVLRDFQRAVARGCIFIEFSYVTCICWPLQTI